MSPPIGDLTHAFHSRSLFEKKIPLVFNAFLVLLFSVLLSLFLWTLFGELDVIVNAHAVLRPAQDVSTMKNLAEGIVLEKNYIQGQKVTKGAVLWRIADQPLLAEKSRLTVQLQRLRKQIEILELFRNALEHGSNTVPDAKPEAQVKAQVYFDEERRLELSYSRALEAWNREKALPAGVAQPQRIRDLKVDEELAKAAWDSFHSQASHQLYQDFDSLTEQKDAVDRQHSDIDVKLKQTMVLSSIDGVVDELRKVNPGDLLLPGEEILRIVPEEDTGLKVELTATNQDITQVRAGMPVVFRFTILPPTEFGQIVGKIVQIPADSSANQSGVFVFGASIDSRELVNRKGEMAVLRPGMTAEARIIIKKKQILLFLLEKLDFLS